MNATRDAVLSAALQLEEDGKAFYLDAAEKASNALAESMLKSFADDEDNHIEWIKTVAPETKLDPQAIKTIYSRLRGIFAEAPDDVKRTASVSSDDLKAIELAAGMEQKSIDAYEKWAKEAETEDVRALCETLAKAERIHREILENARKYLESTGDWFLEQEQGLLDGGA